MKTRLILCLALLIVGLTTQAQQAPSLEIKGGHNIYPVKDKGVVLLDRTIKRMTNGDLAIRFIRYDSLFQKQWESVYPFSKGLSLAFQKVDEHGIYLLFTNKNRKQYELIWAATEDGNYERSQYTFSEPFLVSELVGYYGSVWVSGKVGQHPIVFELNPTEQAYKTVPIGLPGKVKYAGQLKFNRPTKSLDYVLIGEVDKQEVVVWRSIDIKGQLLTNAKLPIVRNSIRDLRAVRIDDERLFIAGQYSVGQRPKIEGLFTGIMGPKGRITYTPFKEVGPISSYKRMQDASKKGFEGAKAVRFNKPNRVINIDKLQLTEAGEIEMALEVFTDDFRARGVLEKQIIARDRTAQLDLNTYGRRNALSGNTDAETKEDLMRRGSATDQLQYRYMDQSLSKTVSAGMFYNHSGYLRYTTGLQLTAQSSLAFNMKDNGQLINQVNFQEGSLRYFNQGTLLSFTPATHELGSQVITQEDDIQLLPWFGSQLLGVRFEANPLDGFTLYRFSAD